MSELFIKYPEMKTLFKLIPSDTKGKKWDATSGEILPETAPLHYLPLDDLVFTEKIDGTNMGIRIDNGSVSAIQKRNDLCSKTDNNDTFYFELGELITEKIMGFHIDSTPLENCIIYGELCGVKIQNGENYFPERRFIVFDIYDTLNHRFFTWDALKYFCESIGLEMVPEIQYDKTDLSVDNVKDFVMNQTSVYNNTFGAEGMVIRYRKDTTVAKRWMGKIRKKDFRAV